MTPKKTAATLSTFLTAFAETGNVSEACAQANISRTIAYKWRQDDEDFAASWDNAEQTSHDRLEREAFRRAAEGTEKPVTVAGKREIVREYSDTLLIFLLKARRPDKYRENVKHEHTGANDGPIVILSAFPGDPAAVPSDS